MLNGYKIKVDSYVDYKLVLFLDSLKMQYYRRFNDSGIYNVEDMILDYYITTDELGNNILDKMQDILTSGVFGRLITSKTEEFEEFKIIFSEKSYTIIVFCKAVYKKKIIYVENIHITN